MAFGVGLFLQLGRGQWMWIRYWTTSHSWWFWTVLHGQQITSDHRDSLKKEVKPGDHFQDRGLQHGLGFGFDGPLLCGPRGAPWAPAFNEFRAIMPSGSDGFQGKNKEHTHTHSHFDCPSGAPKSQSCLGLWDFCCAATQPVGPKRCGLQTTW